MHRLREKEGGCFFIEHPAEFVSNGYLSVDDIGKSFDFAYNMTFGNEGWHRDHRSGGQVSRKKGEIFIDAFQGKLSEFAFYNLFRRAEVSIKPPDLEIMAEGLWDSSDFIVNGYAIAVKSTKYYGNLLLLETKDWDDEGRYIPNMNGGVSDYDFFVLIRIKPDGTSIMKENRLLYLDRAGYDGLKKLITETTWIANITGFITRTELFRDVIKERMILPQNSLLNGKTRMDAENYYIQAGDLRSMTELSAFLRNNIKSE